MLQRTFNVARQIFHAQIAYRNAEVISRNIFQFVRFIEDYSGGFGADDARIGRSVGYAA